MFEDTTKFFTIENNNVSKVSLPQEMVLGFKDESDAYYFIKLDSYISSKAIEEEDYDLDIEYQKALPKFKRRALELIEMGFKEISLNEYKLVEKKSKENKHNNFISNFSEEEKFIYNKIFNFIEEYDITSISQKQFLTSLRKDILEDQNICELYLEEKASRMNRQIEDIFDLGIQGLIVDFANETRSELEEVGKSLENTGKKNKIKM